MTLYFLFADSLWAASTNIQFCFTFVVVSFVFIFSPFQRSTSYSYLSAKAPIKQGFMYGHHKNSRGFAKFSFSRLSFCPSVLVLGQSASRVSAKLKHWMGAGLPPSFLRPARIYCLRTESGSCVVYFVFIPIFMMSCSLSPYALLNNCVASESWEYVSCFNQILFSIF